MYIYISMFIHIDARNMTNLHSLKGGVLLQVQPLLHFHLSSDGLSICNFDGWDNQKVPFSYFDDQPYHGTLDMHVGVIEKHPLCECQEHPYTEILDEDGFQ